MMPSSRATDQVMPGASTPILEDGGMDVDDKTDAQTEYYLRIHESQKEGSYIADDLSYVNIPTPSGMTDGSFEMVRSYSDNSNRTGEESDNPLYATPSQGSQGSAENPWEHGADYRVDFEISIHDRNDLLIDMGSEPRTKYDPYQQSKVGKYEENISYQENMVNYSTYSTNQAQRQGLVSSSRSSKLHDGFEEPWNPMDRVASRYVSGDTAFAPSPEPAEHQDQEDQGTGSAVSPQRTHSSQSRAMVGKSRPIKSKTKGKQKTMDNKWIFVTEQMNEEANQRRPGVRKGQLAPQVAKKARRIREIKACWKCRVQKVPCSEGEICETCRKQFAGLAKQMCCRSGLHEYVPVFFPEYLHSHLNKKEIEDLITANSYGFLDTTLDIDVSTGAVFEPLGVQTHVFDPKTWELVGHYQLAAEDNEQVPQLVQRYSAPIGIMGLLCSDMKVQCKEHIEAMIRNPLYTAQVTTGHRTKIPRTILETARKYNAVKDSALVHDALMLHAIHHFMGSLLTLTTESAMKVYKRVKPIGAPPGEYLSSRLLNRQIKYVMHLLHREIYRSVLEGLEKSLKSRSKESWGPSFCALLVLCLCIEELQTAADTFIICDIQKDGEASAYNRNQSFEACLALEERPFQQCTRLFHDIYRSRREASVGGSSRDGGFNPLRVLACDGKSVNLDKPTDEMAKSIYGMIYNSYGEIFELSTRPSMVDHGHAVDPSEIKANNTGRVAAKFLVSFFENP